MSCRKAKQRQPLKSIVEEYKCGKARLMTMLEDSEDPAVRSILPQLRTGKEWKVDEASQTPSHDVTDRVLLPVEHGRISAHDTGDNVASQPTIAVILDIPKGPSSPTATPSARILKVLFILENQKST
ncbi:reverse transcriptase [Plakobranchus ocellatus]|uniref:Reverse transcriptase n=1 Tax=Plakobranchus ocellatus TaxID=259542 RepID=A0AAV4ASR5_9GAST|nr:reverse transcriptase [Plakobranchus ocellatus]